MLLSFLQLTSEAEEIAEMKKDLADVKSKIARGRRKGKLSHEKLLEASRRVEATQRKLKKLQDVKKHPGKAARKSPSAMGTNEAAKQELMYLMVQRQDLRKKL